MRTLILVAPRRSSSFCLCCHLAPRIMVLSSRFLFSSLMLPISCRLLFGLLFSYSCPSCVVSVPSPLSSCPVSYLECPSPLQLPVLPLICRTFLTSLLELFRFGSNRSLLWVSTFDLLVSSAFIPSSSSYRQAIPKSRPYFVHVFVCLDVVWEINAHVHTRANAHTPDHMHMRTLRSSSDREQR